MSDIVKILKHTSNFKKQGLPIYTSKANYFPGDVSIFCENIQCTKCVFEYKSILFDLVKQLK